VRAIVQRVSRAAVRVGGETVGEIGPGLLVFLGVHGDDTESEAAAIADKIANLRVLADDDGRMNRSVLSSGGGVLVVSQFTLYADTRRGRRPSFIAAATPETAEPLVDAVGARLAGLGIPTAGGVFGAHMEVELTNDGPVTLILES
jgi:D-tyrosyl-tRNA(Tyr) deacylase